MTTLYDFRDYKDYLSAIGTEKGLRSGFKSGLAQACGCNSAYISNVLGGKAQLSLEQAESASAYLGLSRDEAHYFLLLVQRGRAGTPRLRKYFDEQIDELIEQRLTVQKRLGAKEKLSAKDQSRYYSSWIYAAIHVALSIPRLARSVDEMADYFDLPPATVRAALDFLVNSGLAVQENGRFNIGPRHIHLGKNSENIERHHSNWRLRNMRAFEENNAQNLNYSSAVTMSAEDSLKVREILLGAIKNSADLIMKSPEEEVYSLAIDFVSLRKGAV